MDSVDSSIKTDHRHGKHDTGSVKRKPVSKSNGPQFTIPRLKKIKRELLTDLPIDGHECQQEILPVVRKSFHFPISNSNHVFTKVQSVHNPELTSKYLERRKDMKGCGYPDPLVADTFAFLPVENAAAVEKMCRDGVRCGNQQFSGLGVSHMAVHVCKHADVLTPMKPKFGDKIFLMVKVLKGKIKTVLCKNVGVQLEPTPNYDCHIAKPNVDQPSALASHMLFYTSQLYVYEYGDCDLEDYPRQVLPYAVVYYSLREPPQPITKSIPSLLHHSQPVPLSSHSASLSSSIPASSKPVTGPSNEVWRGRLHIRLVEGGHIYIEVSMLSYFVPLTVGLISPIKIHGLYPEHNAQFTFFCGLTNISQKDEVEWRAHYFRYCIMRPRANNEEHFKALVKHISAKREMPTAKLADDVFLFLMPNCLLASQLGLVQRDDNSPVLHCVIMSKHSTSQSQEKKLAEKGQIFKNYGSASSWEDLFDDSDFSEDDDELKIEETNRKHLVKTLPTVFHDQRSIQNKFAAMSIVDADINFSPCACKKLSASKVQQQCRRDSDVTRVLKAVQSVTQSSQKPKSHFPSGSRQKPKQKMSRRARAMPSFSPHGSSDSSDSDLDNGHGHGMSGKNHDRLSLLHSTKTVEEELSEEELTNEQMEDIIFLRKPALSLTSLSKSKSSSNTSSSSTLNKFSKQSNLKAADSGLKQSHSSLDFKRSPKEPSLSAKPKIIPVEPIEPVNIKPVYRPKIIPVEPKIIPTEPLDSPPRSVVNSDKLRSDITAPVPVKMDSMVQPVNSLRDTVKPILKSSTVSAAVDQSSLNKNHTSTVTPDTYPTDLGGNDFGDVDMRVPNQHSTKLHPVFLTAVQPPTIQQSSQQKQQLLSPNLSFGSWLAPADIQPPPQPPSLLLPTSSSQLSPLSRNMHESTPSPPSPISLPADSPPSPIESPASPPVDSPASPASPPSLGLDSESPASPPQSTFVDHFRSSPIAIPTSRIMQNASPEISFVYQNSYFPHQTSRGGSGRERIDNADDMKDFLNSGFDSDLDSSYEDER